MKRPRELISHPKAHTSRFASFVCIAAQVTQGEAGARFFAAVAFQWGLVADVDIESESMRCLGGLRFTVQAILRIIHLRKCAPAREREREREREGERERKRERGREREWSWWAHTRGGNALAFKPPPNNVSIQHNQGDIEADSITTPQTIGAHAPTRWGIRNKKPTQLSGSERVRRLQIPRAAELVAAPPVHGVRLDGCDG